MGSPPSPRNQLGVLSLVDAVQDHSGADHQQTANGEDSGADAAGLGQLKLSAVLDDDSRTIFQMALGIDGDNNGIRQLIVAGGSLGFHQIVGTVSQTVVSSGAIIRSDQLGDQNDLLCGAVNHDLHGVGICGSSLTVQSELSAAELLAGIGSVDFDDLDAAGDDLGNIGIINEVFTNVVGVLQMGLVGDLNAHLGILVDHGVEVNPQLGLGTNNGSDLSFSLTRMTRRE